MYAKTIINNFHKTPINLNVTDTEEVGPYIILHCPYVNLSTEKDPDVIERNKEYLIRLKSVAWTSLPTPPSIPLESYINLPEPWLKFPVDEEGKRKSLLSCGWYPGKEPCWRGFDVWHSKADLILFAVDYGLSGGMKKCYEENKHKAVLVTLKGIEEHCESGIFPLFEKHPPTYECEEAVKLFDYKWENVEIQKNKKIKT